MWVRLGFINLSPFLYMNFYFPKRHLLPDLWESLYSQRRTDNLRALPALLSKRNFPTCAFICLITVTDKQANRLVALKCKIKPARLSH